MAVIDDKELEKVILEDAQRDMIFSVARRYDAFKYENTRKNVKVSNQTFEAYQMAMGHYAKGEYKEALEYFTKAAEGNHSPSMYKIGVMYHNGEGVEKDLAKAKEMFEKAIKNDGDTDSVYMIADMYYYGRGVEQNKRKAFDLFIQAGFADHAGAQAQVGALYLEGVDGILPSKERSFAWYNLAARNNEPTAIFMLASFYLNGECVEKNSEIGVKLLKVAADQHNYSLACRKLGNMYRNGDFVEKDEKLAFEYIEKAVKQGDIQSALIYAQMKIKGQGCEKNVEGALNGLEILAFEHGVKDAALSLANNYLFIDDVEPNPKRAVEVLRPLLNDPDVSIAFNALFFIALLPSKYDVEEAGLTYKEVYEAMKLCEQNTSSFNVNDLGLLYLAFYNLHTNGKYLKVNEEKAREYLAKSTSFANFDAMLITANHTLNGTLGIAKNMKGAFSLYQSLEAIKMTPELAERLAYCYRFGKGTTKAIRKAEGYEKIYTELTGKEFPKVEEDVE